MKLLGISGSLSKHSKTGIAVNKALEFAKEFDESLETELVSLSDYDLVFCDGRNPDLYIGDTRRLIDKVTDADVYIIGSPIYRGTFTGALKNLFDLIPNDALKGKAVGIIATGGSNHHFLAIEHHFKPIFGYFNAYTVPAGVYVNNSHYNNGELTDTEILERLEKLSNQTVRLSALLKRPFNGPDQPEIKRESLQST